MVLLANFFRAYFAIFLHLWLNMWTIAAESAELPKMLPITDEHRMVFATVGKAFVLRCPVVTKYQKTFIEWSKGSVDLYNTDSEGYTMTGKGQLKIRNVTMENAGFYICNATNGYGSISIKIQLIVDDPRNLDSKKTVNHSSMHSDIASIGKMRPKIEEPQVKELQEESGGAISIHCSAIGYPAPYIIWLKNNNLIDGPNIETKRTRSRAQSSLVLQRLQSGDAGTYRCIAKNDVGRDRMDFTLFVTNPHYPPEIMSITPLNGTVISGNMIVFRCKGRSLPFLNLHIKWLKTIQKDQNQEKSNRTFPLGSNYYQVLDTDEDPIISDTGRFQSELLILNASIRDSGAYVCLAVNDNGFRFKVATLKVFVPTKIMSSHPSTSPSSSFMLFVVFSTSVVIAPIVFLSFLYCKCRISPKVDLSAALSEVESLKTEQSLGKISTDQGNKNTLSEYVDPRHHPSKLLSTHATKIYDCSNGCSCPLQQQFKS